MGLTGTVRKPSRRRDLDLGFVAPGLCVSPEMVAALRRALSMVNCAAADVWSVILS
jgi:hypothetical protein